MASYFPSLRPQLSQHDRLTSLIDPRFRPDPVEDFEITPPPVRPPMQGQEVLPPPSAVTGPKSSRTVSPPPSYIDFEPARPSGM